MDTVYPKFTAAIIIGFSLIFFLISGNAEVQPSVLNNEEIVQNEKDINGLLNQLAFCESSNNPGITNWNDNGSPSYGLFQFKKSTFLQEVRRYKMLNENNLIEWENWAYDGEFQKKLVYKMLSDEKENWRHWYNCGRKIGLDKL